MGQSNLKTCHDKPKAPHQYKISGTEGKPDVAGKRFHFIGAGGIGMSDQGLLKSSSRKKSGA